MEGQSEADRAWVVRKAEGAPGHIPGVGPAPGDLGPAGAILGLCLQKGMQPVSSSSLC